MDKLEEFGRTNRLTPKLRNISSCKIWSVKIIQKYSNDDYINYSKIKTISVYTDF